MQEKDEKIGFDGIDDTIVPSDKDVPSSPEKRVIVYLTGEPKIFSRYLTEEEAKEIHLGNMKPLKCRKCNLYFVSRSELMKHVWSHRRKEKR